jgi:SAM-dependent methyltransferase
MAGAGGYADVLGGQHPDEARRLRVLGELTDPDTIDHLRRLGIGVGWRCLEVGAGSGSTLPWLCAAVGERGGVVATDLDTRFLSDPRAPNLRVVQHDIAAGPPPGVPFDLIHCRFVLEHVPTRDEVLPRLASYLAPGGWLLVEAAYAGADLTATEALARLHRALLLRVLPDLIGVDLTWARRLPRPLRDAGLADVDALVVGRPLRGASPGAGVLRQTAERVRGPLLRSGLLTGDELDAALRLYDDPDVLDYATITIAAWGRRPGPVSAPSG